MSDAVTFEAAFPPIQSAIKVYGDRQGMRIQLDIPESEMGDAMSLFLWRGRAVRVTVEPVAIGADTMETIGGEQSGAPSRRKAKRRV